MTPQLPTESVQETLQKAAELKAQTDKTKKEIQDIDSRTKKLDEDLIKADKEITRLPNKKSALNAKITKLQTIDRPLLNLNNTKDNLKLDLKHLSKNITDKEFEDAKKLLSISFDNKNKVIDDQIVLYQEELSNSDRSSDVQKTNAKQKSKSKKLKLKINKDQKAANIKRLKSLAKKGALLILPIVVNAIVNKLINNITKINQLNEEVDALNLEIEAYNKSPDPVTKNVLVKKKNALLNKINQIQKSVEDIKKSIDILNKYNQIFTISITVAEIGLSLIPQPSAGTVGFQAVVNKIKKIIETATLITQALASLLPIISSELDKVINDLEEVKSRIKNLEDQLENNNPPNQSLLLPPQLGVLNENNTYKGFKFVIKEENTLGAPVVNGIHRHYGVAIDGLGIEVLKTDPSFTQDIEVLVDQLKFIIDSQNLKG
jgi:hypothetical protein